MDNEQVDMLMTRLNNDNWSKPELIATIGVLVKNTNGITLKNFDSLLKNVKQANSDVENEM